MIFETKIGVFETSNKWSKFGLFLVPRTFPKILDLKLGPKSELFGSKQKISLIQMYQNLNT